MTEISRFQFVAEAGIGFAYRVQIKYKNPNTSRWEKTGSQCSVSLGQEKDVNLYNISEIKEGAEVCFFMSVKSGPKDKTASETFIYKKDSINYAKYNAKGTIFNPQIKYKGISTYENPFATVTESDSIFYGDISCFRFFAQAGIGYAYRIMIEYRNKSGETSDGRSIRELKWQRTDSKGTVKLGEIKELDLKTISDIREGAAVRFHLDVVAGTSATASQTFIYHKNSRYRADYNGKGLVRSPKIDYLGRVRGMNNIGEISRLKFYAEMGIGFAYAAKIQYRSSVNNAWETSGKLCDIALGQNKIANLSSVSGLKEGDEVRFYMDIKVGDGISANETFTYKSKSSYMAQYNAKGTTGDPVTIFQGRKECVDANDPNSKVNSFQTNAVVGIGFVYTMKIEYKNPTSSSTWESSWKTFSLDGTVALGQSKSIKLQNIAALMEGALVRLKIDASLGDTKTASETLRYSKNGKYLAIYDITGTTKSPTISFKGLENNVGVTGMAHWNSQTDKFENNLEFVNVEGVDMDDPHTSSIHDYDDKARCSDFGECFTAYMHFIDIRAGKNSSNDYNGYSYGINGVSGSEYYDGNSVTDMAKKRGKEHLGEFWTADGWALAISDAVFNNKKSTDAQLNYWFNDEYIHTPGKKWYRHCSPSVWNYCYNTTDKYTSIEKKYPLIKSSGAKNKGVPYSVFASVDDLGRFWYEKFLLSGDTNDLGPALHAVQDACIPQHAAGVMGNHHSVYESAIENYYNDILSSSSRRKTFNDKATTYFKKWRNTTTVVNDITYPTDLNKVPSKSWRIDHLITWMALQAYDNYSKYYAKAVSSKADRFSNSKFDMSKCDATYINAMEDLLAKALAMTMLVLEKAKEEFESISIPTARRVKQIVFKVTLSATEKSSFDNMPYYLHVKHDYCGGSLEYRMNILNCGPNIKLSNPEESVNGLTYQRVIDTSACKIDSDKLMLELEKGSTKAKLNPSDFEVIYKTADNITHSFSESGSSNFPKYEDETKVFETIVKKAVKEKKQPSIKLSTRPLTTQRQRKTVIAKK